MSLATVNLPAAAGIVFIAKKSGISFWLRIEARGTTGGPPA